MARDAARLSRHGQVDAARLRLLCAGDTLFLPLALVLFAIAAGGVVLNLGHNLKVAPLLNLARPGPDL